VEFLGGNLSIARSDYFIADGNVIVHSGDWTSTLAN
jgi:hypothetical protein